MSLYRHLLRHTATYSVAVVMARISGLLLLPVYTHFLTPAAYGLLDILEIVNTVFGPLIGNYLSAGMNYFYAKAQTEDERREVLHTGILGAHLIAIIAAGLGWLISPLASRILFQSPDYVIHCRVMFVNLGIAMWLESGTAVLRIENSSRLYVGVLAVRLVLGVAVNVTLLSAFHMGALAMLIGGGASTLAAALWLDARNLWGVRWRFRFGLLKEQIRYSYPLGVSAIGMTFVHSGDRFFLQRFGTLTEVGLYGMAYRFGTLVGYIQAVFETYWMAQVFQVMKHESGERYYVRTLTYYALASSFAAVVVSLFSYPVVRLFTPKAFHESALLIPLISACYAWRSVGDYFRYAFALEQKTAKNIGVTLCGVALAAVSYTALIPPFKAWGAAAATAVTFVGMNIVAYRAAQKVRRFEFEWRRLWTIGGCAVAVMLPGVWIGQTHIAVQFLCAAGLTLLYPVLLWAGGVFEREEIAAALDYMRHGRQALRARVAVM